MVPDARNLIGFGVIFFQFSDIKENWNTETT